MRRRDALAVLALAALGCNDKAKPEGPAISASAAARYQPVVLRFADPGNGGVQGGVLAYAKREGILERALAEVNARIEWVPGAQAFSANFEAMNSGAINASGGAISPIVGALAHNLKFKIFSVSDPAAVKQAGILVPGGSPVRSLADLAGRRVAVNLAAHGDYILLKALANAGVPADKVTRVPIQPPDAAAAFATGKIDAWSTFGVFFSTAVRNGARVLAYESDIGSDDVTVNAAATAVLEKNPAAFQIFIKEYQKLVALAHQSPEKFQNVFTDKGPTALAGDELRIAIEQVRQLPVPHVPAEADRVRVANVARLFVENRSIDRDIGVDEIVFDVDRAAAQLLSRREPSP